MKTIKTMWNKWLINHGNDESLAYIGVLGILLVLFIVSVAVVPNPW